jgi:glycosyltransferase involved in cell wall biosynthesis
MSSSKPVIQFILPMAGHTGGVAVVYRYANALHKAGYPTSIIYPGVLYPKSGTRWRVEAGARRVKYAWHHMIGKSEANWFPLNVPLFRTPSLEERYIPRADITVVTSCETAEWAGKYPEKLGTVLYLIQGYETWSLPPERLHPTYNLPFHKIAVSSWLKEKVDAVATSCVEAVLLNGVDLDHFTPPQPDVRPHAKPTILLLSHDAPKKGFADGVAALEQIRMRFPDVNIVTFGTQRAHPLLPRGATHHHLPDPYQLRTLYQSADIFLCPAREEGGPLTNMEAMACATPVVTTDVGAVRDYTLPGVTALVSPPEHPTLLAENLMRLLNQPELARNIGKAGPQHIQAFSWEQAEQRFVRYLEGLMSGVSV